MANCRVPLNVDDETPVKLRIEGAQGLPLAVGEAVIKETYEDYDRGSVNER